MALDKVIDSVKLDTALTETANAIRDKSGTTEPIAFDETQGFKAAVESIETGSGDNHYDTFWDNYQDNGNRDMYYGAFPIQGWNDENYNPKYVIKCSPTTNNAANDIFRNNTNITDTKVDIDITDCVTRQMFDGCLNLKTIAKLIVSKTTTYYRPFRTCQTLENITFEGEIGTDIPFGESQYLSDASIQNIIDHLADLNGTETQTLDFHSAIVDKLTAEQLIQIYNKNWSVT